MNDLVSLRTTSPAATTFEFRSDISGQGVAKLRASPHLLNSSGQLRVFDRFYDAPRDLERRSPRDLEGIPPRARAAPFCLHIHRFCIRSFRDYYD